LLASLAAGRRGRRISSPPQFGQMKPSFEEAQVEQNVHSKEQISAFGESGGRSVSQHSQPGLSSSMGLSTIETLTGTNLGITGLMRE